MEKRRQCFDKTVEGRRNEYEQNSAEHRGVALSCQGKYTQAEEIFWQALHILRDRAAQGDAYTLSCMDGQFRPRTTKVKGL